MSSDTPTTRRARRCAMGVGWQMPQILPPLSHCRLVEDASQPTLAMEVFPDEAVISVNPDFVKGISDAQLGGVMAHEMLHLMLLHGARRGLREPSRWNRAADRAINAVLRAGGIKLTADALYPPPALELATSEQLYDHEPEDAPGKKDGEQPRVGGGCAPKMSGTPPKGDQESDPDQDKSSSGDASGSGQGAPGDAQQQAGQGPGTGGPPDVWREVAAQARAMGRGTHIGNILAKLLEPPPPRARFEQVIRQAASSAVAQHGRDDQSWARRSRRSPPGIVLPGWTACKARLAVIIDASGSMSDEMLNRAAVETARMQNTLAGLRIFLVVHDYGVQVATWVSARTHGIVMSHVAGRGGTAFEPAYERVAQEGGRFDACVHLTDGEIGHWPALPDNVRRFIVARLGEYGDRAPEGAIEIPVEV